VRHRERPLKIGSFSAASNVTGILTDVDAIAALLHEHGALSFWDFAAAAPYVGINMGSRLAAEDGKRTYLDAVFLSPHKLIGGPGTPGVLVARRELFTNRVPVVPGGGTVLFVSPTEHHYLASIEHREEGGTPAIVDSIRAGLVFQLRDSVGIDEIRRREGVFVRRAIAAWEANPNLQILGSHTAERLSIVSFVVRHKDRYLHHNVVVALLNDVFGIQSRGGCSCAGPYGHRLLGIDLEQSHHFEREIARGCEGIKPGWVRVNFNYFITDETFDYIVQAVDLLATEGWRLLPWYRFEPATGLWRHRNGETVPPASLLDVSYATGAMTYPHIRQQAPPGALALHLKAAHALIQTGAPSSSVGDAPATTDDFEHLRWFPYPSEV
jgi:selenocysteine lyase/cysteine desulfurase